MSRSFLLLSLLIVLVSLSFEASALTGTATFYTPPYQPSSCNGFEDDGVMIAAASNSLRDQGGACGTVYKVKCTGGTNNGVAHPCKHGTVTVKIVDYCPPPGCHGTIDLSQEAFAKIANPDEGKIKISFHRV